MKIVQINTFPYKATGSIMLSLQRVLLMENHECYSVWGRGRKPENSYEISIYDKNGIRIHGLYSRLLDKTGFASTRATKKLVERLEEIDPDIIHLHNLHGYYLNIEILFRYIRKNNKKVVWTLHDCWAFTGHCAYFDRIQCQKWKTGCNKCPQLNTYPKALLVDNSLWNWKKKKELFTGLNITFVTPSIWLQTLVKQSFLQKNDVVVIHNGIDLNIFTPVKSDIVKRLGILNKKMILGVASEWTERKGLKDFFELQKQLSNEEYQIVLIGLTNEQIKSLPVGIIGLNRTQNIQELVEFYSSACVFVNPTYEDNYPTTNLEAIACGTPVVTYNTGGSPETLEIGITGYVVEQGNIKGLIENIVKICQMQCSTLGLDMYKYSKEKMLCEYMKLYNKVEKK